MIVARHSTEALPRSERFTWWHDMTVSTLIPTVISSDHAADFHATADVLDLGAARITSMSYAPVATRRTRKLIRQHDPGYLQLSLTARGTMGISQCGRTVSLRTGDLVLYDSSSPFDGWAASGDGAVKHVVAQIPKRLLPVRTVPVEQLVAARIPGDEGFGTLLSHFLIQVTARAHEYGDSDAPRLSTVLSDLLAGTMARRLDDERAQCPDSRRRTTLLRVQNFIREHLGDAGLAPGDIAAANHISVRTLHRLFQDEGLTVAAYIRRQRLEHARRDLADPTRATTPVHAVAARWGFPHPSDFSRAFRNTYGMPPGEYRRELRGGRK